MNVVDDLSALRAALAAMCREFSDVPEEVLFDSKLVADELLSNALRYGGGRAYFSYTREGDEIRLFVRGEKPFCPPEHSVCADVMSERGRGLYLIDSLAESRGFSESDGICAVIRIRNEQ